METCDVCREKLTEEAVALGWPIPRLEDGVYICPDCYGAEAFCACGAMLSGHSDHATCPECRG